MPYFEFRNPDQDLKKDVDAILEIGLKSNPKDGLLERAKACENLKVKWEGKVSSNFIQRLDNIINLSIDPKPLTNVPQLPNENKYQFPDELTIYVEAVKKQWNALIQFYTTKQKVTELPSTDHGDRFVFMTDALKKLSIPLTAVDKKSFRPTHMTYVAEEQLEWPGRKMVKIIGKEDSNFFMNIGSNSSCTPVDMFSYIYHEEIPQIKKVEKKNDTKGTKGSVPVTDTEPETGDNA